MATTAPFEAAVREHDSRLAAAGVDLWVGSEPTFTDRTTQSPPWLNQALGGDKAQRAQALLVGLHLRRHCSLVVRSVGRQYPGEDEPRWGLGLYRRRDGLVVWQGPPDPALVPRTAAPRPDLPRWAASLAAELGASGYGARVVPVPAVSVPAADACGSEIGAVAVAAQRVVATWPDATQGGSALAGDLVFELDLPEIDGSVVPRIVLPRFDNVPVFLAVLAGVERAALASQLPVLIVAGKVPPVDATVELTAIAPDPAVVEFSAAPSVNAEEFLQRSREIYAAAAAEGLSPYRLYYNGAVADSGGGGQITLGGASPQASPFLRHPLLLPRLVCFCNRHPALSYLFSHDHVGGSGQSARADERGSDALDELQLALGLLERQPVPSPEQLWQTLAPFLCDASGNSHRSEINIEKLWSPFLGERGRAGLVEFRALRMQHSPERATALACLLRAVVGMLVITAEPLSLVDWGRELHERHALPFYLEQDLREVLQALNTAGLGLGPDIEAVLLRDEFRLVGQVALPGNVLEVRRALEFSPLVGDAASPEQGGASRLVDASTARVELRLRPGGAGPAEGAGWQIRAEGIDLPMRRERDADGELQVFGLRYRRFVPERGLHPRLPAQDPVRLTLRHPAQVGEYRVALYEWHPAGSAYAGLPADLDEAGKRRAERLTVEHDDGASPPAQRPGRPRSLSAYSLDLRWLA
ncbi:MAG: transglutaminase family protein [Betaproteobacteria bacterium]|nr:transglutaminase family protein [Betaproteobacteria bacterium]